MEKEREISLPVYIKQKIRMLKRDFLIKLKPDEEAKFWSLKDKASVYRFAHTILLERL